MKPSEILERHRKEVREIVAVHGHSNPRVFGSVARGDDDEISDLDFLIEFRPHTTLFDLAQLRIELQDLLGVEIDVVNPKGLPDRFRERVLEEAVTV